MSNENGDKCDKELCICITPHPSQDAIVPDQKITVKFQISETQTVAQVYSNCKTIGEIKNDIASKFEINPEFLNLSQMGVELDDDCVLYETCSNEYGIVEFSLKISESASVKSEKKPILDIQIYYNKFRLADFITVHCVGDFDLKTKDIIVEIHNNAIAKPFIGGYKNPRTGIEYHDAFSQTGPSTIKFDGIYSRNTQTCSIDAKSNDTSYDHSTQAFCDKDKLIYISSATDYVIVPRKYETYIEKRRRENRIGKIILIQRNFRRYLLMRHIKKLAAEYRRLVAEQKRLEEVRIDRYVEKFQQEIITKTFPKTREDFEMLYNQVQKWKQSEVNRINSMYSGGPRIAEFYVLLDKEIQLLLGIEKQKNNLSKAVADINERKMLQKMSEPVKWIGYNDLIVEMDLMRTQRVRTLTKIYDEMKKNLSVHERVEILNSAEVALSDEKDRLPAVQEFLELIDREKNLLLLAKHCKPEILRKRQQVLLVEIIKHTEETLPKKNNLKICGSCKGVKPVAEFSLYVRQHDLDICNKCSDIKTVSTDNCIYSGILRAIQREERRVGALSSYAFLLQTNDIKFIVLKIWHGHSILSKEFELSDLRLPRWIKSEDWSPWNCICLTELEARHHNKVNNLSQLYEENIIQDIKSKHLLAKVSFKKLQDVEEDFVESGDWWNVGIKDKVL